MPTSLPPRRPVKPRDPRGPHNLAAFALSLALIVLGLWLLHALTDANAKLNCIWSGRTNCDRIAVFEGHRRLIGQFLPVTIYDANAFTLFGTVVTRHAGPEVYAL